MDEKHIQRNILMYYLFSAARGCLFCIPFMVPFWKENGMDMTQIMIVQAIFSFAVVVLEVPSGYVADKIGRRNILVLGGALVALGFGLYSLANHFYLFIACEIILAIGFASISGADAAFVWETLEAGGRQDEYKKIFGRGVFLMMLCFACADAFGSFLVLVSVRWTVMVGVPFLALMPLSALIMKEPWKKTMTPDSVEAVELEKYKGFSKTLKIFPWKSMIPVIIPCALLFTSIQSVLWFYADIFDTAGFSIFWYGWIFAAFNIFAGLVSANAGRIEKILGIKGSQVVLAIVNVVGLSGLIFVHSPLAVIFCFGAQFTRGMNMVVFSDALNRRIKMEYRATALSVMSLAGRLGYSALIPFLGMAADAWGTSAGLAFLLGFSVLSFVWILFIKDRNQDSEGL